ncbi:MAG: zinc-binding dehydrogenase [Cyclobacteriaceae bacterium]|nr:zinc-binding dehydrogenase [Cyclobacteriaceae bacterium HetDA_MAG_MS6]
MKAYPLTRFGKANTLKIKEVADPEPQAGEVKVKVSHIGINYAEILSRRGQYRWAPKRPYVPGMEAFGEVVALGEGVMKTNVGDQVIIGGQYGAYAEYHCVPEYMAFPALGHLTDEENAAVMVNFMTAWVALVKLGKIAARENVLIQAAAGGVGTAAVQIAKAFDCHVFGTASRAEKLELIKSLEADHAINYEEEDFLTYLKERGAKMDVVLEVVGGEVFRKSLAALGPFGRMVVAGFASIPLKKWNPITWWQTWKQAPKVNIMEMAKASHSMAATHIGYLTYDQQVTESAWEEMSTFIIRKKLKPVVGKVFDFDQLPAAHEWIESRKSVGKAVIKL